MLSTDLREELATIAPRRQCCRLAEVSALLHTSGAWHLRSRRRRGAPRPRKRSGRAARVHAPARPRRPLGGAHLSSARVRPGDALPAARRRGRGRPRGAAARQACSRRPVRRSSFRRSAWSAARAAVRPTCAARCSASGSLSGPRDPHLELRASTLAGAQLLAEVAAREDVPLNVVSPAQSRRRLREAPRGDPRPARADRGGRDGAAPRGGRGSRGDPRRGQPARERRRGEPRCAPRTPRIVSSRRSARSAPTASRLRSPRSPSCVCAIRRRRCASWPGRRGRRSRRRRFSAGSRRSLARRTARAASDPAYRILVREPCDVQRASGAAGRAHRSEPDAGAPGVGSAGDDAGSAARRRAPSSARRSRASRIRNSSSPEVGKLLDELRGWGEAAGVRLARGQPDPGHRRATGRRRAVCPPELRADMSRSPPPSASQVWIEARKNNDFAPSSRPSAQNLDLRKRYVECFDDYDEPYDVAARRLRAADEDGHRPSASSTT